MPSASPAVLELVARIEAFCQSRLASGGEQLAADMRELRRGVDVLDVRFSEMAAAFAQTDQYELEGSYSPIHWMRQNCHMTSGAAAARVAVGEHVEDVPRSLEAMSGGEIGFAHLALIAGEAAALAESGSSKQFDEARLLEKARDFNVGRFRNFCHHERHSNDPAAYAADETSKVEARSLSLKTGEGGMLWIRGVLDPAGGATLRAALEPLAQRAGKGDDRRLDRRLADAAVELADHALDRGTLPRRGGQRPHLQITATLDTLQQRCGAPAGDLVLSLPISAAAVGRIACDCSVTRFILGADSQVIDVGRTTRRIPPSTRRALHMRDKRCMWPGCDRPASWTSAHHLRHWIHGGPTDLDNLVLLCGRHHWMVHEAGWIIVRTGPGEYRVIPPMPDFVAALARGPDTGAA